MFAVATCTAPHSRTASSDYKEASSLLRKLSRTRVDSCEGRTAMADFQQIGVIETWLRKHRLLYTAATRHPLILDIRDGTIDMVSFKRWLAQDFLFVRGFVPFVATVLVKAWKESADGTDMEVILKGLTSLDDEISWFKKEASKWSVELGNIVPQKANQNYSRFLESLMSPDIEYTVAMTALWSIELVYQQSFSHCLEDGSKTPQELKETCERWGSEGFAQYCQTLQRIAEHQLHKASDDLRVKAETTFLSVLELEVEFWNMSRGDA